MRATVVVVMMRNTKLVLGNMHDDVARLMHEGVDRGSQGLPRQHDHQQNQNETAHGCDVKNNAQILAQGSSMRGHFSLAQLIAHEPAFACAKAGDAVSTTEKRAGKMP